MRATFRKYSRHRLVHAIIIGIAILIGVAIALAARPTRGGYNSPLTCSDSMSVPPAAARSLTTSSTTLVGLVREPAFGV
jgi:hypothetical protein